VVVVLRGEDGSEILLDRRAIDYDAFMRMLVDRFGVAS
jgi:hypothetical protein